MTEVGEQEHFARQLESDKRRALETAWPDSIAARILNDLYPRLRGKLYPKSRRFAGELKAATSAGLPVNLLAVLVPKTIASELPFVTRAVQTFTAHYQRTVSVAVVADWPEKLARLGTPPPLVPTVEETVRLIRQTKIFGQIVTVGFKDEDQANLDPRHRQRLISYLTHQVWAGGIDYRVLGFEAEVQLAMRRKIGQIIQNWPGEGFTLGLTTELNPGQMLRYYGQVWLANIEVSKTLD